MPRFGGAIEHSGSLRLLTILVVWLAIAALGLGVESLWILGLFWFSAGELLFLSWTERRSSWPPWFLGPILPAFGIAVLLAFRTQGTLEGDRVFTAILLIVASGLLARSRGAMGMVIALCGLGVIMASEDHDSSEHLVFIGGYAALVLTFLARATAYDAALTAVDRSRATFAGRLGPLLAYAGLIAGFAALFFSVLPLTSDDNVAQASSASPIGILRPSSSLDRPTPPPAGTEPEVVLAVPVPGREEESADPPDPVPDVSTGGESALSEERLEASRPQTEGAEDGASQPPTRTFDVSDGPETVSGPSLDPEAEPVDSPATEQPGERVVSVGTAAGSEPAGQSADSGPVGDERDRADTAGTAPKDPPAETSNQDSLPQSRATESGLEAKGRSWRIGDNVRNGVTDLAESGASGAGRLAMGLGILASLFATAAIVFRRGRRGRVSALLTTGPAVGKERREIIEAFQRTEVLLAKRGFVARSPSETPARYLGRVGRDLSESVMEDLRKLGVAVTEAVYGPTAPGVERIAETRRLAESLESELQTEG